MRRRRSFPALAVVVGVVIVALALANKDGDSGGPEKPREPPAQTQREPKHEPPRPGDRARARAASPACPPAGHALDGVYDPQRLRVIDACRSVRGRVKVVREEEDGDLHIDVALARRYRGMLMRANYAQRGGYLVVEFMPRDRGHLPAPTAGDRVRLVGAYVDDTDHAWSELHPVWQMSIGGRRYRSGPGYGGSPRGARSYNAVRECRRPGEKECRAYAVPGLGTGLPAQRRGDKNCSDFPTQAAAQRYFIAKGGPARDPAGLDRDHDGRACTSLP